MAKRRKKSKRYNKKDLEIPKDLPRMIVTLTKKIIRFDGGKKECWFYWVGTCPHCGDQHAHIAGLENVDIMNNGSLRVRCCHLLKGTYMIQAKETRVVNAKYFVDNRVDPRIYIGRKHTRFSEGSIWANPFPITASTPREMALEKYRNYVLRSKKLMRKIDLLRGKILVCWCAPKRCHGDVLIEILNKKGRLWSPDMSQMDPSKCSIYNGDRVIIKESAQVESVKRVRRKPRKVVKSQTMGYATLLEA